MSAAERAFFDGDHCQHIAARDEQARLQRKRDKAQCLFRRQAHGRRVAIHAMRCVECRSISRQCDFCFSMAAQR